MIKNTIKKMLLLSAVCATAPAMAAFPVALTDDVVAHQSQSSVIIYPLLNDTGTGIILDSANSWTEKGARVRVDAINERLIYSPKSNFAGKDTFWYVMKDLQGRRNAAKITVTVKPSSSRLPDPQNDVVSVQKNKTVRINVLKNDLFKSNVGQIVEFNNWSDKGGQITKNSDDQLSYTPPSGFVGTDTFWYVVKDASAGGIKHAAKVTVKVNEFNSAGPYPQVKNDTVATTQRNCLRQFCVYGVTFSPTANDIGKNLRVILPSNTSSKGGKLRLSQGEGREAPSLYYEAPFATFRSDEDIIWYVIEDEIGRKNWGSVTVDIN